MHAIDTQLQNYSIDEHTHRFAVWTAARAAAKSLLKNSEVEQLLQQVQFRAELKQLEKEQPSPAHFDQWHRIQCERIIAIFEVLFPKVPGNKQRRMSHGIAAKIINIYIKTAVVLPTLGNSPLARVAHPPVDSILLKALNKKVAGQQVSTTWSLFDFEQYKQTIDQLRLITAQHPFWAIELFWKTAAEQTTEAHNVIVS